MVIWPNNRLVKQIQQYVVISDTTSWCFLRLTYNLRDKAPPGQQKFFKKIKIFLLTSILQKKLLFLDRFYSGPWWSHLIRWSGRRDSNSRPTVPKTVALPGCATPRESSQNKLTACNIVGPKIAIFQEILSQECTAPAIFPLGPSTTCSTTASPACKSEKPKCLRISMWRKMSSCDL